MRRIVLFAAFGGSALVLAYALRSSDAIRPAIPADIPVSHPSVLGASPAAPLTAAHAAVVIDAETGNILVEQHAFEPRPLASLTKIASAMIALDHAPDLTRQVTVLPDEYTLRGGNLRLQAGETVSFKDVLFAGIVGSANNAAYALPRLLGVSDNEYAREMNRKAVALGLETVRFTDAAGFQPENVGSAYDMARLAAEAFAHYPLIAEAAATREYVIIAEGSGREHVIRNTNRQLSELDPRVESKTGYLDEALFCLVLTKHVDGKRLVAVVLGHPSEAGVVRDARALLDIAAARLTGT